MATEAEAPVPELKHQVEGSTVTFLVSDSRQMLPAHTVAMDAAIRELARTRDVGLLATTTDAVRGVHPAVAPAWIKKITDPSFRLRAIAVVTPRSAVRGVANGVGQAIKLLGHPLVLECFHTEAEARAWLKGRGFLA
jgi:hypothetical protein